MIFISRKAKYLVTGTFAGLANGFFGSGGGLFIVPLLTRWVKLDQRRAFATSVAVILPLSVVSAAVYFWKGALDLSFAWPFLLGGAAGGLISGRIFQKIPLTILRRIFGALILYGGVRALLLL
ncbi:sulfite exporter TauE/SafE family protein [Intestinibacillus massiliensis]|nr:sulfite exporter TauE/SafE family protein [Intestinibacillus massiliensis]